MTTWDAVAVAGAGMILAGITVYSWPAALIALGAGLVVLAWRASIAQASRESSIGTLRSTITVPRRPEKSSDWPDNTATDLIAPPMHSGRGRLGWLAF